MPLKIRRISLIAIILSALILCVNKLLSIYPKAPDAVNNIDGIYDNESVHAGSLRYRLYTTDPFSIESFIELRKRDDTWIPDEHSMNFSDWFEGLVLNLVPKQSANARVAFYTNECVLVLFLDKDGFSAFDSMMRDAIYDNNVFRRLEVLKGIKALSRAEAREIGEGTTIDEDDGGESARLWKALQDGLFDLE